MLTNYYDELKNDILEALEEEEEYKKIIEQAKNKEDVYSELEADFFLDDSITGNASGSYYFSTYESRKHCYNFFRDVFEALEDFGYKKELQLFKTFVTLVEEGYLNIEDMTLDYDLLDEVNEDERYSILNDFEELEGLDFEKLDVITRCYYLDSVLFKILDNYLN